MNLFNWKVLSRKKSHILQNLRTTNIFGIQPQDLLCKLNHGRLETIKHPELDNFHIVNYIYFHPETQMLVIGTLLDGIYLYNIHSRQLIDVHNGLQDINVNSIIASKENENEVLIATNGAGVYN